jgi:hypothetical protein
MELSAVQDNYVSSFIVSGRKLLTTYKQHSPSLEANTNYGQAVPRILPKPKVQHRIHKNLPAVPSQTSALRSLLSHLFKNHFNPLMLGSYFM